MGETRKGSARTPSADTPETHLVFGNARAGFRTQKLKRANTCKFAVVLGRVFNHPSQSDNSYRMSVSPQPFHCTNVMGQP